jgi:hypothetical protein
METEEQAEETMEIEEQDCVVECENTRKSRRRLANDPMDGTDTT